MPEVIKQVEVQATPEAAFAVASDLGRFDEWLTMHEGWPDGVPESTEVGAEFSQQLKVMGMSAPVKWTVEEWAGTRLTLVGAGPMGATLSNVIEASATGDGSTVSYTAGFAGGPAAGPMGGLMARKAGEELDTSLATLRDLLS